MTNTDFTGSSRDFLSAYLIFLDGEWLRFPGTFFCITVGLVATFLAMAQ